MGRHGQRQRDLDELAFPIRLRIAVPRDDPGRAVDEPRRRLREELGPGAHASRRGWPDLRPCLAGSRASRIVRAVLGLIRPARRGGFLVAGARIRGHVGRTTTRMGVGQRPVARRIVVPGTPR